MKVLVVSSKYPPEYSGSGLRAHNTYTQLAEKYDIQFDVLTSSITSNQTESYIFENACVHKIAHKLTRPFHRKKQNNFLRRIIHGIQYRFYWQLNYWSEAIPTFLFLMRKGSQYDVIHVFGNVVVTAVATTYAKITRKPLLVELVNLNDNPTPYEPRVISWIFGKGLPQKALIVCLSERLKQTCLRAGYTEQQIWCRPNPIPQTRFNLNRSQTQNPIQWPNLQSSDILIVQIAKFRPLKNQKFMVEVLARLPESYKLILAGPCVTSGPLYDTDRAYYESTLQAIEQHQLKDRILIIPQFIEAPETYMKWAQVYVIPSTSEAFGTPCLEAIACGVPVVVTEIQGVFDQWIKPGFNGYMCPLEPDIWAKKIQQAHEIPVETRRKASEEILEVASSKTINQMYYDRLASQVSSYAF